MGACPKHRTSRLTKRKRRTHYKAVAPTLSQCTQCFEPKLSHRVCPSCGHYNKKTKVLDVETQQ
jgi:large subunit ribosomal protein L32